MKTYFLSKLMTNNSKTKATVIYANTLRSAKRQASRTELFKNRMLILGSKIDSDGYIPDDAVISIRQGGLWADQV